MVCRVRSTCSDPCLPPPQAQELSLNYHCKCEQWVHFGTGSFFNFNGTAGVWRRKCIESIGGWNSRTTVSAPCLARHTHVRMAGWTLQAGLE